MRMQIGKWGNSLAVRLPREIVDRFGLKEGDVVDTAGLEADLARSLEESLAKRRAAALKRMEELRWPLPKDWKFDREEANAR